MFWCMRLSLVDNILAYRYLFESLLNGKVEFFNVSTIVLMIWRSDLAYIFECRKFVEN